MGQYYHPIILGKNRKSIKAWFYSHKYGNGLKLMEHSYVDNNFVNAVVNYLVDNNGGRLVWAGDYADPEKVRLSMAETLPIWQKEVAEGRTNLSHTKFRATSPLCLKETEETLYSRCTKKTEVEDYNTGYPQNAEFFVNHDKKEIIELYEVTTNCDGYQVHPLPLLTCEGNGRGGGDYYGSNQRYVGTWARDFIQPYGWRDRNTITDLINNKGYKKIHPCFFEQYALKSEIKNLAKMLSVAINDFGAGLDGGDIIEDHKYLAELHEAIKGLPEIPAEFRKYADKKEPATANA